MKTRNLASNSDINGKNTQIKTSSTSDADVLASDRDLKRKLTAGNVINSNQYANNGVVDPR